MDGASSVAVCTCLADRGQLRDEGLRYVGLVHFSKNRAATPAFGWRANRSAGLSDFGCELVDELNERRILVDLAHINRRGFMEAAERSSAPVIVSHTGGPMLVPPPAFVPSHAVTYAPAHGASSDAPMMWPMAARSSAQGQRVVMPPLPPDEGNAMPAPGASGDPSFGRGGQGGRGGPGHLAVPTRN